MEIAHPNVFGYLAECYSSFFFPGKMIVYQADGLSQLLWRHSPTADLDVP